jgi:3-oxoacyl-[acyl-carrier-protein] synthase-3
MAVSGLQILGSGGFIFPEIVTNEEILGLLGNPRTPEWMVRKIGIEGHSLNLDPRTGRKRYPEINAIDYAERAARQAIDDAGASADAIDHLILCTCTPAYPRFWADAIELHRRLGMRREASVYQIDGGCAALANAFHLAKRLDGVILMVAANDVASFFDAERYRRVEGAWLSPAMFADGAGAVLLGPNGSGVRLGEVYCAVDGTHPLVTYAGGGAAIPTNAESLDAHAYIMDTKDVVAQFAPAMQRVWRHFQRTYTDLRPAHLRRVYPHQANFRLVEALAREFKLPLERVAHNVDRIGNTVSASTLLLLDEDRRAGRFPSEGPVLFTWVGAGMFEGGAIFW